MLGTILSFPPEVAEKIAVYCEENSTPLPKEIEAHKKFTRENFLDADKMVSSLEAQLFIFLAKVFRAKRILEIGCYSGYSALAWAEGLKNVDGAEIITLDLDPKMIAIALATFEKHQVTDRVKLLEGPAMETMKRLHGQFDIIFIDADKPGYKGYFDLILEKGLLTKNGIILTDNSTPQITLPPSPAISALDVDGWLVLSRGLVVDDSETNPHDDHQWRRRNGAAMKEFNAYVAKDPRVEIVVLPLFDGLGLIRLKD